MTTTKFQLVRYGKNEDLKNKTLYFTDQMKNFIEQFESLKDLGVYMNDKTEFSTNFAHVVKKSRQKMGWILRSFHNRKIHLHMLKTLVTPHIDYNSQLWMPIECTEIAKVEK